MVRRDVWIWLPLECSNIKKPFAKRRDNGGPLLVHRRIEGWVDLWCCTCGVALWARVISGETS